jgi:transcriptional activator SPT7
VLKNVLEFRKIKDVHSKILASQNMIVPDLLTSISSRPKVTYTPVYKEEQLPAPVINEETSLQLMKQICAWLAVHSGYDSCSDLALSTLTDVAAQFISNLCKTIRVYMDRSSTMSGEDVLLHTLQENGISEPEILQDYITHDIKRYGSKLEELRKKLESAFNYLENNDEEDLDMDQNTEQLMSGNFLDVLGLDFLNLKEFGLDFSNIPLSLWNKKSDKPIRARVRRNILSKYFIFKLVKCP